MKNLMENLKRLPSLAWVIIFPLLIILVIGFFSLLIYLTANIEWFATAVIVVSGFVAFKYANQTAAQNTEVKKTDGGFVLAVGIVFFALMGMAIDQPGNFVLNYPLNVFCENNSTLERSVDVLHPLPGRTDMIQDFSCYDSSGNYVNSIGMGYIIATRFIEYVLIGYGLHYLTKYLVGRKNG